MDMICIGKIMSYLAHNVRPILQILSSSVSDWCTQENLLWLIDWLCLMSQMMILLFPFISTHLK